MPYYTIKIELRGRVHAADHSAAMAIAEEIARNIATGDVGHLSDHMIDETEATDAVLAADQQDD